MPIRGDVNAILNGLMRDDVITEFETNFGTVTEVFALHVRVTADLVTDPRKPGYDRRRFDELRGRILRQLEPLAPGVVVSLRETPGRTPAAPPSGPSGEQCRAARRLLGWSLEKHASAAGVGLQAIGAFERGESTPRLETLAAILRALQAAGVEFTDEAPGARLRKTG